MSVAVTIQIVNHREDSVEFCRPYRVFNTLFKHSDWTYKFCPLKKSLFRSSDSGAGEETQTLDLFLGKDSPYHRTRYRFYSGGQVLFSMFFNTLIVHHKHKKVNSILALFSLSFPHPVID